MADDRFLIWSEEHLAWWRPNRCGYTNRMRKAGAYSRAEAEAIVASANYGTSFNETIVPLTDEMERDRALPSLGR